MTNPSSWPTHILLSELSHRQQPSDDPPTRPACGTATSSHSYNTPLHVFALFLILILSTFACSFPLLARRFPRLPIPTYFLFLCRHFGTGVLIATAFVHLFPTAYTSLTDPCLPRFWTEVYPAMSGFIAMCSVLVVVGVEMGFAGRGAGHSHGVDLEGLRGNGHATNPREEGSKRSRPAPLRDFGGDDTQEQRSPFSDLDTPNSRDKPLPPEPPFEDDSDLDLDELDPRIDNEDEQPLTGPRQQHANARAQSNGRPRLSHQRQVSFASPLTTAAPTAHDPAAEQRLILQCLMLEAGILFHSIFIGMALSVSTGPAFVVLLIAISFHQTFEGLALGSRIAAIPSFSTTSLKPWAMSLLYGVTTPLGQAIGLAVHRLYDPASMFGLLTVGCVNAVSAGLLLYAGLVQLLAEDFLSEQSYVNLKGKERLRACGAVVAGSMLMAFVGAFA